MKIDRLMGILIYLLSHGRTSSQKLAGIFEVAPRTIMRDLESLDRAGIPIQSFPGVDGGYQIMDSFLLEKQAATSHEYDWIVAALKGMSSAYASKGLEQALAKVQSLCPGNIAVSLDLGVASEDRGINGQLKLLEDAIGKKCAVRFSYTNSRDEVKELQVEPVCLQYKWYNWYLIGYHEKHQDYCMFKLVRMENIRTTDCKNTKEHLLSEIRTGDGDGSVKQIRLYGKASIKAKCREYLNGQITQEYENGDFEFCFSVPEHEAFWYGVVLSFGDRARIIEPQDVIERILKTCRELQTVYEETAREENQENGAKQHERDQTV